MSEGKCILKDCERVVEMGGQLTDQPDSDLIHSYILLGALKITTMKLDELYQIKNTLSAYRDFTSHNGDGDESGIVVEMFDEDTKAIEAIDKEIGRIRMRNALARVKRKRK